MDFLKEQGGPFSNFNGREAYETDIVINEPGIDDRVFISLPSGGMPLAVSKILLCEVTDRSGMIYRWQ